MTALVKPIEMPKGGYEDIRIYDDGTWARLPLDHVKPTPHGRLIDADKLYKRIKAECNPYGKPTIGFEDGKKVLDIIDATPTVIEAEEG